MRKLGLAPHTPWDLAPSSFLFPGVGVGVWRPRARGACSAALRRLGCSSVRGRRTDTETHAQPGPAGLPPTGAPEHVPHSPPRRWSGDVCHHARCGRQSSITSRPGNTSRSLARLTCRASAVPPVPPEGAVRRGGGADEKLGFLPQGCRGPGPGSGGRGLESSAGKARSQPSCG